MRLRPSPTFPSFGQAVLLVIGALILQVAGSGLVAAGWAIAGAPGSLLEVLFNPWTLAGINLAAMGFVLNFGRRAAGVVPAEFYALRSFPASLLPALVMTSLGLAIVLSEVDNLIMDVLRRLPGFQTDNSMMHLLTADAFSSFLLLIVIAPVTEEYLFRGLILRGLLRRHRPLTAIILTAVLFSLMHANLRQLLLTFVIGVVFGWWTVRTRSLAPALIGHAVFNSVAYAVFRFPETFGALGFVGDEGADVHQPWWLTTGGLALAALGAGWFHHRADKVVPPPPPIEEPPVIEPPLLPVPPVVSSPQEPPQP